MIRLSGSDTKFGAFVLAGIEGVERNAEEELQLLLLLRAGGCSAPLPVPERPRVFASPALRPGVVTAEASGE